MTSFQQYLLFTRELIATVTLNPIIAEHEEEMRLHNGVIKPQNLKTSTALILCNYLIITDKLTHFLPMNLTKLHMQYESQQVKTFRENAANRLKIKK